MNVIHITTDGRHKTIQIPVKKAQSFDKAIRPMLGRVDAVPAPEYMTSSWNDADDRECDPYNIPDGFIATTIAIHLGKRIG